MKNYFKEILLCEKDFLGALNSVIVQLNEKQNPNNQEDYSKCKSLIQQFNILDFAIKNNIFASYENCSLTFNFTDNQTLRLNKLYYNRYRLNSADIEPDCIIFSHKNPINNLIFDYYLYDKEFEFSCTHTQKDIFTALLSINKKKEINLDYDNQGRPQHEFTPEQIEILNYLNGVIECSNRDSNRLSEYFLEGKDFSNEDLEIIALTTDINVNSFKKFNEASVNIFDLIKNKKNKTLKNIG